MRTTQPLPRSDVGPATIPPTEALIPRTGPAATSGLFRAALLVPLTGPSAQLGQALANAAQMALFEVADERFVLQIYDTQGTPDDAARATAKAINEGAQIILGPVFAVDARAAGVTAAASGINVVTFSTDASVATGNVFVLGFVVQEQVRQIVAYAHSQGRKRFAVLAPETAYGTAVVEAFKRYVPTVGGEIAKIGTYSTESRNQEEVVKEIASFEARRRALVTERGRLAAKKDEESLAELKRLEKADTFGDVDFEVLMLPDQGAELTRVAALLPFYDIDPARVQFLGTLLWNTPNLGREPALVGGIYPSPSPEGNRQFAARYREAFGAAPPTLASHAYDAVALAAALAHSGSPRPFAAESLTAPAGFAGVDGIFRFLPNGLSERGFAIMQVTREGSAVLRPAPSSFTALQY